MIETAGYGWCMLHNTLNNNSITWYCTFKKREKLYSQSSTVFNTELCVWRRVITVVVILFKGRGRLWWGGAVLFSAVRRKMSWFKSRLISLFMLIVNALTDDKLCSVSVGGGWLSSLGSSGQAWCPQKTFRVRPHKLLSSHEKQKQKTTVWVEDSPDQSPKPAERGPLLPLGFFWELRKPASASFARGPLCRLMSQNREAAGFREDAALWLK